MKKPIFILFAFIITACVLLSAGFVLNVSAQGPSVDVHISLPPPPRIFIKPPEILVIPGSPVVVAPHPEVDIFFYGDYWWSPRGDRWYRSNKYDGPWKEMKHRYVPEYVRGVPRNYRSVYKHEHRMPYGQWKKQRKHWKKENYKTKKEVKAKDYRKETKHKERKNETREERPEDRREDGHGRGHGKK
ncbi:MAG: hypothetical protein KKC46_04835 [Proteobacteria bacterium]|nr:hypothetical protein [Pseudomonadota bacterium]